MNDDDMTPNTADDVVQDTPVVEEPASSEVAVDGECEHCGSSDSACGCGNTPESTPEETAAEEELETPETPKMSFQG